MRRLGLFATIVCLWIGSSASAQILVTDFTGNLTSYNPATNTSSSINSTLAQPGGMTIGPDGFLYVSNMATSTVDKYNPFTGAFVGNVISATQFGPNFQPTGIKFGPGPNPDLFISNQVSFPFSTPPPYGGVYRYNLTSQTLTPVLSTLVQPNGLLFAGGNMYVSEFRNYTGHVLKYDFVNPATEFIANVADPGGTVSASTGMAMGPDGGLYVADVLLNVIHRYDLSNPANHSVFINNVGLYAPSDLVFDGGHLYVSNIGSGTGPDGFLSMFDAASGAFQGIAVSNLYYGSGVVAVPEPTSLALLGIGAVGWLWRRRRIA